MDVTASTLDPRGSARAIAFALRGLQQRYEVTASNLANLETAGHKRLVARSPRYSDESFAAQLDQAQSDASPLVARDFTQGEVVENGDPSELALQGDGFFAVETGGELRYERGVRVSTDADGTLVDGHGGKLLGESGPVRVSSALASFQVQRDGTVKSDDAEVGKLRVIAFVDPQKLTAEPNGRFRAPEGLEVVSAQNTEVVQRARERSNTDAVHELVELIVVQRQYEAAQRALVAESELRQHLNEAAS
jgi:flagellar basal-body rod protein FlgF